MKRKLIFLPFLIVLLIVIVSLLAGTMLSAPHHEQIGDVPAYLNGENVFISSASGATLRGWFVPGQPGVGAVALMHGVRASRTSMLGHATFLSRAGYSVLLFDFQAHGESTGEHITFGQLESKDASSAVDYLHSRLPNEKVGVIGVSLGGAAALLAQPKLNADAMIVEMVFSSLHRAIANRMGLWLGNWGENLAPLLCWQLKPRLGIDEASVSPLDHIGQVTAPLFVIGCAEDQHTKLEETQQLFNAAHSPKQLWIINGAAHVDPHSIAKVEYEQRVLEFFTRYLKQN